MGIDSSAEIKHPAWIKPEAATGEKLVLSIRDFKQVVWSLRLPHNFFTPDKRVLSVGEGLSNFSRILQDEHAMNVVAVDPIFAFGRSFIDSASAERDKVLEGTYGELVQVQNETTDGRELSNVLANKSIAADVNHMPFTPKSFDTILSNRLWEHINLASAIEELLPLMKSSGEIRFGGALLSVIPQEDKLLSDSWQYDEENERYYPIEAKGFHQMIEKLRSAGCSAYIFLNTLSPKTEIRDDLGYYATSVFIIRNDELVPEVDAISSSERERLSRGKNYPYLGKMYKVGTVDSEGAYHIDEVSL